MLSHFSYEAVKDEAGLIQDSLLPAGALRGTCFEVAFRYAPLVEVGGDFADFFSFRTAWSACMSVM
jgi:serine phosphatase RsbU (regulator of sigma subunit)